MLSSIFIAQIFGLFFTIMGVAILVRGKSLQLVVSEIIDHKGTFFLLTVFTLIMGIILILVNNIWVAAWPVFITILCWFIFLTALVRIFFLEKVQQIALKIVNQPNFNLKGIIPLVIGIICLYFGFIHS
ncbi:MAG: hypothetical protein ACK4PR_04750 [Gammaproteobacteria bacterium]